MEKDWVTSRFVNLHGHTIGSQLDAIVRPAELFDRVRELGQRAVAVTDHGNMSQIYQCYKESKRTGVKLIPGNEIYFVDDLSNPKAKRRHLVLLASNEEGYKNLLRITARGFENSVTVMGKEFPRVDAEILRRYNAGLFATSACGGSIIAAAIFGGDTQAAREAASMYRDIFGDRFFIELQPHSLQRGEFSQRSLNAKLKELAEDMGIRMVATCDSHYLLPSHEKYHDMVLAISDKKPLSALDRHRYATYEFCTECNGKKVVDDKECAKCVGTGIDKILPCAEFYLKSEQEVFGFFEKEWGADFANSLIENTCYIADSCEDPVYIEPRGERLPKFDMKHIEQCDDAEAFKAWRAEKPERLNQADDVAYLKYKTWISFKEYTKDFDAKKRSTYWKRLVEEIDVLETRGFCSYMLIVADFIDWAKKNDVWVGPGRGSCPGCLAAYFLGIHEVDSIEYGLLFERFQNKMKKSLPDIDSDFESSGRDKVIQYVISKYGRNFVANISNINRITPKVAIKDIARSLEIGGDPSSTFKLANDITGKIPLKFTLDNGKIIEINTIELAEKYTPELREFFASYPEVREYADRIVGLPRANSVHAAGVAVSDIPMDEFVPLRRDKDGTVAVQYDKNIAEEIGLVKIDFLGLDTIDILREAYNEAHRIGINIPKPWEVNEKDSKVYDLISSGRVLGMFQLEGGTLAHLCAPLKPKNISDIALINALGRPGVSKENRKEFIERRFGRKETKYVNALLEPVSRNTLGISIYEEDLLKIAQLIAGWDLSEADGLRKLTKLKEKGGDLAIKLEKKFVEDTVAFSKITKSAAQQIWDEVIINYARYGFNKAHAISYSKVGYRTAYYKRYATAPFLCAVLNSETRKATPDSEEYINDVKKEIASFGISIRACDINNSKYNYRVIDKKNIVTGLNAVKGLGEKALEAVVANQPYACFEDFIYRSPSCVNKSVIQSLAMAGAFDSWKLSRKAIFDVFDDPKLGKKIREQINKWGDKVVVAGVPDNMRVQAGEYQSYKISQDPEEAREQIKMIRKFWNDPEAPAFSFIGEDWDTRTKMQKEKEVLGGYVSGSMSDLYPGYFKGGQYNKTIAQLKNIPDKSLVELEGLVISFKEIMCKNGRNAGRAMGKITVENVNGESIDVTLWPDQLDKMKNFLVAPMPIRAQFKVGTFNGNKVLEFHSMNKEDIYVSKDVDNTKSSKKR